MRPGHLTFSTELIDSDDGEVLARAAGEEKTDYTVAMSGPEADWLAIEKAARRWAGLFREFLDANLARQ